MCSCLWPREETGVSEEGCCTSEPIHPESYSKTCLKTCVMYYKRGIVCDGGWVASVLQVFSRVCFHRWGGRLLRTMGRNTILWRNFPGYTFPNNTECTDIKYRQEMTQEKGRIIPVIPFWLLGAK